MEIPPTASSSIPDTTSGLSAQPSLHNTKEIQHTMNPVSRIYLKIWNLKFILLSCAAKTLITLQIIWDEHFWVWCSQNKKYFILLKKKCEIDFNNIFVQWLWNRICITWQECRLTLCNVNPNIFPSLHMLAGSSDACECICSAIIVNILWQMGIRNQFCRRMDWSWETGMTAGNGCFK